MTWRVVVITGHIVVCVPIYTDEVHTDKTWWFASQLNAQEQKISLLQGTVMKILSLLKDAGFASFAWDGARKDLWSWYLIVLSECCDICERKNTAFVKDDIAVTRRGLRCLLIMDEICDLQGGDKRLLIHIMLAREEYSPLTRKDERMK